jgi:N-acetylmuramoyl-L-alanine amidase
MPFAALLLAAVSVAFPRDGAKLPFLERSYIIGAVGKGETNVVVQGRNVPVYRTGAWATTVKLAEGSNTVDVVSMSGEKIEVVYHVAKKPSPARSSAAKTPKKFQKLSYAADEAKDPPTNRPPSEVTIVIDAGHGGDETGALSPHGHCEKDANLKMARCVRDELRALGYNVVMTREDDRAIGLYDRPKVAHRAQADAFVSIHHNAPPLHANPLNLRYHAVYAWNDIGRNLARSVNESMAAALGDDLKDNGVISANFVVVRNPEIPSCLIEVDFITDPAGEEDSWSGPRRIFIAKAIAGGIASWCSGK